MQKAIGVLLFIFFGVHSVAWTQTGLYVHFPNDLLIISCDPNYNTTGLAGPTALNLSGGSVEMTYTDVVITSPPDACYKIERTWVVKDPATYNPQLPLVVVPNPNPNLIPNHASNLPGPTVSPQGTTQPWNPTIAKIVNSDPAPTYFYTFWDANANGYQFTQIIKFLDNTTGTLVIGRVALDENANCIPESGEPGVPEMQVKATDSDGNVIYGSTGPNGVYAIAGLAPGAVTLEVTPWAPVWTVCNTPATVTLNDSTSQITRDFSAQADIDCPLMSMQVGIPLLRACTTSTWYFRYCNLGADTGSDAAAVLEFAPGLSVLGVSQPANINGNTVTVPLGDVLPGDCGYFTVSVETDCDASLIGTTLCVEAHIFPDSLCLPANAQWQGAQIEARAVCDGDSVRFELRNTGTGATAEALDYVIIDDMVIMFEGQLPAGFQPDAMLEKSAPAGGSTVRLMAEQATGNPVAAAPSVAVDDCNGLTLASRLLDFPNEDGSPFTEYACREVVGSLDPNEKLAYPRGVSNAHFIEPNTSLRYQLNFQNTGNDTAFLVVLRDTLSTLLHPASLRMGVGSHPFLWKLDDQGVLTVTFKNIYLPDSTTNEPASHGFVQFDIAQKADNPIGSVIENRAGIYFDINPVVMTNTVFHTVGNDFIPVATAEPKGQNQLNIYPNPATDFIYLRLEDQKQVRVQLTDLYGRTLRSYNAQAPGLMIRRNGLADGIYLLEVQSQGGAKHSGRVVWQKGR